MNEELLQLHQRLTTALDNAEDASLADVLADARAADVAEVFEVLDDEERSRLLFALPPHTAAEVVILVDEAVRGHVVEELDDSALRDIVLELQPDDAADILGELDTLRSEGILEHIPDEQSGKIEELLRYERDTAGGIMTSDVVSVPAAKTIQEVVEDVRNATQDEELHSVYVVDDEGKLVGVVPLRRLVTNPLTTRLGDISLPDPVRVRVNDDQEEVVQVFRKYDISDVAVIDEEGHLIGRITHDDAMDVAEQEAVEDLFRMAGTDAAELQTDSVFRAARIRLMWLLPCMVGMLVSAGVLGLSRPHFDAVLFGALVLFVPMIGATGGNTGIQISTVIVRGLATGELGGSRLVRALGREGPIATVMAPICGVMAWLMVWVLLPVLRCLEPPGSVTDPAHTGRVAMAAGCAMTVAILGAGGLGILLPFMFRKFGVDPAIASGPLVTTTNDIISVGIYMLIAMAIVM